MDGLKRCAFYQPLDLPLQKEAVWKAQAKNPRASKKKDVNGRPKVKSEKTAKIFNKPSMHK